MTDCAILDISGVTYTAGGKTILDRVSWRVEPQQHWALLGPNGAGKTTLLRIACGYLWPNAGGAVRRQGRELTDLRELRCSIGWISSSMIADVPAAELALDTVVSGRFAMLGLRRAGTVRPAAEDYDAAREYLARMGCPELACRPFGVLSQGEQQKVLIARARMARPLLIFLDEPCAGMDPGARERFLNTIGELVTKQDAPSLVLVTHHIEEIVPGMDHTLILHEGRVVRCGPTETVIDESTIGRVYGVSVSRLISENGRLWPIWDRR